MKTSGLYNAAANIDMRFTEASETAYFGKRPQKEKKPRGLLQKYHLAEAAVFVCVALIIGFGAAHIAGILPSGIGALFGSGKSGSQNTSEIRRDVSGGTPLPEAQKHYDSEEDRALADKRYEEITCEIRRDVSGGTPLPEAPKHYGSEEDRALADKCYEEMKTVFPEFAKIPRRQLAETVTRNDGYFTVSFRFWLGGTETMDRCTFSTGPRFPDGRWSYPDDSLREYYGFDFTEEEMKQIRSMLLPQIREFLKENKLSEAENYPLSEETLDINWTVADGRLTAVSEYIGYVTPETKKQFGCGDHAHIFANVFVDISDGKITLSANGPSGG